MLGGSAHEIAVILAGATGPGDQSSSNRRLHHELNRWVNPEKGRQKKRNERLSRSPEKNTTERASRVGWSDGGAELANPSSTGN
jgi:hypothetical protein